jgi:hypothetical protein
MSVHPLALVGGWMPGPSHLASEGFRRTAAGRKPAATAHPTALPWPPKGLQEAIPAVPINLQTPDL